MGCSLCLETSFHLQLFVSCDGEGDFYRQGLPKGVNRKENGLTGQGWLHEWFKLLEPAMPEASQPDDFFTQMSQSIPDFAANSYSGNFSLLKQKEAELMEWELAW